MEGGDTTSRPTTGRLKPSTPTSRPTGSTGSSSLLLWEDPLLGPISGVTSTGSPAALPAVEWGGRAATLATYLQDKSARGGSSGEPQPAGCGTYPPARRRRATSRLSFCARPNRRSSAQTPHSSLRPSSDGAPSSAWRRAGSPRPGWPQPPSAARRSAEPRASPAGWRSRGARWWRRSRASGGCGATATCATWSAPWTHWPRPTARLLTWRRIDDYGAETGSPSLAKFNNERDNPEP